MEKENTLWANIHVNLDAFKERWAHGETFGEKDEKFVNAEFEAAKRDVLMALKEEYCKQMGFPVPGLKATITVEFDDGGNCTFTAEAPPTIERGFARMAHVLKGAMDQAEEISRRK